MDLNAYLSRARAQLEVVVRVIQKHDGLALETPPRMLGSDAEYL